jgi:hypothetical protein
MLIRHGYAPGGAIPLHQWSFDGDRAAFVDRGFSLFYYFLMTGEDAVVWLRQNIVAFKGIRAGNVLIHHFSRRFPERDIGIVEFTFDDAIFKKKLPFDRRARTG